MTFAEARAAFPVLDHTAYLNAGSFGPLARATITAVDERLRHEVEEGRSGAAYVETMVELRTTARQAIADLLAVPPESVALTTSTTRGCGIVVTGSRLRPEDEIVTTDTEHFGLLGALHSSGARVRVAQVRGLPAEEAFDAIRRELRPATRLLALSHVSWQTGNALPIAELRAATAVPMLIDGAQSTGAIPVAAAPYDFYTVSGQKWLCGPGGTGALYVTDPDSIVVAAPSYFAQEMYEVDGSFAPRAGAERFDTDGLSFPVLAGLVSAMEAAPEWRLEAGAKAARHCRELLRERGAEVVTEPDQSTLVSFVPRQPSDELVAAAYEAGVVVRDLPKTPWVRASCGYWTSDEDLERLAALV